MSEFVNNQEIKSQHYEIETDINKLKQSLTVNCKDQLNLNNYLSKHLIGLMIRNKNPQPSGTQLTS